MVGQLENINLTNQAILQKKTDHVAYIDCKTTANNQQQICHQILLLNVHDHRIYTKLINWTEKEPHTTHEKLWPRLATNLTQTKHYDLKIPDVTTNTQTMENQTNSCLESAWRISEILIMLR